MDTREQSPPSNALEAWQNLPPSVFHALANPVILERGIQYFEQQRVRSIKANSTVGPWNALVRGAELYRVMIAKSSDKIRHHCNCPAHDRDRVCKHVVAVVALLYFLGCARLFGQRKPKSKYLRSISVLLKDAPAPRTSEEAQYPSYANHASIVIRQDYEEIAYATIEGHLPPSIQEELGFTKVAIGRRGNIVKSSKPMWGSSLAQDLGTLATRAKRYKLPVHLALDSGQKHEISGNLHLREIGYQINHDTVSGWVTLFSKYPDLSSAMRFQLDGMTSLLKNGDIVRCTDRKRNALVNLADPNFQVNPEGKSLIRNWIHGGDAVASRSLDNFNSQSLSIPFSAYEGDLSHTPLCKDGSAIDTEALKQPTPIKANVEITAPQLGEQVTVRLQFTVGVTKLPVELTLLESLRTDLLGDLLDGQLTRAKGRVRTLVETTLALSMTSESQERSRLIEEASQDKGFEKLDLKTKAETWLKAIEANWLHVADPHLIATPDHPAGWALVESPHRQLLLLALGLFQPETRKDLSELATEIMIPRVDLPAFLHRAQAICTATGAVLSYNQTAVKSQRVEVSLVARNSRKIDWFELRAEIRCGKFSIPQDQWEALIRGELLLEENGEMVIPELSQAEAVARLQALFGKAKRRHSLSLKEQAPVETSRLQILDWIDLRRNGVLVQLPDEAERLWQSLLNFTEIPSIELPTAIRARLRDYQHRGFDWLAFLYEHRFGACLADDMGLGKTLQTIVFLAWVKVSTPSCAPFLIILPPSLIFNWSHEIERFCPTLTVSEYLGAGRNLADLRQADVILTTYDLVRRDIEHIKEHHFEVVVFDEVQALKNVTAVRTKAAAQLKRRFTLCLTGTPMENHVGEYYSIMNLATPGIFGSYKDFQKAMREGDGRLLRRARPFMLRRTKDEILKELPPKVESEFFLTMTPEQKEIYTRTVAEVRDEVMAAYQDNTQAQAGIVALAALTRLRQVCISPELLGNPIKGPAPKLEYLLTKMRELLDEGHSALFFSQFTRTLDLLQDAAQRAGIEVLRLDGKTPIEKRKRMVDAFQQSLEPQLFLISLKAGGAGLNLTRAQYVFHIDPWWNPAVENQASDRAHRIGQTKVVFIQRLLMRHTVEEKIMQLKLRKQKLFQAIVDANSVKTANGLLMSKKDFEFLLS